MLGVSSATVRNWARAGHLPCLGNAPLTFDEAEVLALLERIRTNRFNRLRKRANKTASEKSGTVESRESLPSSHLARISEEMATAGIDGGHALFSAALIHLESLGEATLPAGPLPDFLSIRWRRRAVKEVMEGWRERLGSPGPFLSREALAGFLEWEQDDRLGLLYQCLSSVGKKAREGAYFTPGHVIDDCFADFEDKPESLLDPCCGTGRFLIRAAKRWDMDLEKLMGVDADPVAVDIARLNLLAVYPGLDTVPRIQCLDSLNDLANGRPDCQSNHLLGAVDAIATNPPWGGCKNHVRYKRLLSLIKSGESFSLFLEKSLQLVREGGRLSFILPESMLKIKAHADLRRLLLDQTRIRKISLLGRIFSGIFTPIIRLDLVRGRPAADDRVVIQNQGKRFFASQSRFAGNANQTFDATVTPHDERILRKIFQVRHATLKGNADWALGIVTGDNRRLLLKEAGEHTEPILRGRDILKYAYREPRCHIVFDPSQFQQVAPHRLYRAPEKLVYRFVSNQLIFAYDDKQILTLNSANILIPRIPGISIKTALALLNSRVFEYLFRKCFSTRKVLKSDLERFPFPAPSPRENKLIDQLVEASMGGDYRPAEVLDEMVFRLFGLNGEDVAIIESELESWET